MIDVSKCRWTGQRERLERLHLQVCGQNQPDRLQCVLTVYIPVLLPTLLSSSLPPALTLPLIPPPPPQAFHNVLQNADEFVKDYIISYNKVGY